MEKRNNTFQNLHGAINTHQRQDLAFPVLVYLVDKKTRAPRSPKEQPPHAPTDVQEGSLQYVSPWTVFRNAFYLLFKKKQKQHALQIMERLVQFSP